MNKERAIVGGIGAVVGSLFTLGTLWFLGRTKTETKTETKTDTKNDRHNKHEQQAS